MAPLRSLGNINSAFNDFYAITGKDAAGPFVPPYQGPYWITTLGSAGNEYNATDIAVDSTGNSFFVFYDSTGAVVAKYNNLGALQWQRRIADVTGEYGLAIDSSSNVFVAGTTDDDGAGLQDFHISKYNSSGTLQWQRTLGGSSREYGNGITVDSSGNAIIVGHTNSTGPGSYSVLVAKYNTSGTIQWQRSIGASTADYGEDVVTDSSDNIYIVGQGTPTNGYGVQITKLNSSGTAQWHRQLGGTSSESGNEYGYSIDVDSSDNIYVVGKTSSEQVTGVNSGYESALLAKYNSSGTLQWQRILGHTQSTGYGYPHSVAVGDDNSIYYAGQIQGSDGDEKTLSAKYNSSGTIIWQREMDTGSANYDWGKGIFVKGDDMFICGRTNSAGAGGADVFVAKLPNNGSLTGTHGSFVYASTSHPEEASSLTGSSPSRTVATSTLTDEAATLTTATTTLTSSKTDVD